MNQSIKTIFSGLGVFATASVIWMWGYSVGADKSDVVIDLLQEQRSSLERDNQKLRQETESLKMQLLADSSSRREEEVSLQPSISVNKPNSDTRSEFDSQEKKIEAQRTAEFFDGALQVTLITTDFKGNPLRHKVFANVLIPGQEPLEIRDADSGSAFEYGDYQVLITEAGTFSATFRVYRVRI